MPTFKIAKFTTPPSFDTVEVNSITLSQGSNTATITYDSNIQVDGVNKTGANIAFMINGIWYKLEEPQPNWVAVVDADTILTSSDGTTWTAANDNI